MNVVALLTWFLAATGLTGPCVVDLEAQTLICEAPSVQSEAHLRAAPPPPTEEQAEAQSSAKPLHRRTLVPDGGARISNGF